MAGIVSYGGYIPRYRLNRMAVFQAMGWFNPANLLYARGVKAVANYDEDSITMAAAAGIDSLRGFDRSQVEGVYFASTTMPYKERLNAGIIAAALGLKENARAADFASALKSGTTALIAAMEAVESRGAKNVLVCGADCRLGKTGSMQEMVFGDGGAAFLVGDEDVIAEFKGAYSLTCDFVDHYRGELARYDRGWEDRWIRDEGYDKMVPAAIRGLLERYDLQLSDFNKVIYPCHYEGEHRKIAATLGMKPESVQGTMLEEVGDTGTAQPLVMLVRALEEASAGDRILVVSFGSGCDVLWFEVTGAIARTKGRIGIRGHLEKKADLGSYEKYAVFRDIIPVEIGGRGEQDLPTRFSLMWRHRRTVLGLFGSRCNACGTPQFPPQRICVNPDCRAVDRMEDYCFADKEGRIFNYTGDMLAFSYDPPQIYGTVEFDGGGRILLNFTDCDLNGIKVGMPVEMTFRKKYDDDRRGVHSYFWKAMPRKEVA
jgi:hydroxymethylglutaryl-CoA synthase